MRICIDFDGTIMDYFSGDMVPGADVAIQKLKKKGHHITIYTTNVVHHKGLIKGWLNAHNIPYDEIDLSKPPYAVLIDDKAVKFEGWDKLKL